MMNLNLETDHDRAIIQAVQRILDLGVPSFLVKQSSFRDQLLDGKVCIVKKGLDGHLQAAYFLKP